VRTVAHLAKDLAMAKKNGAVVRAISGAFLLSCILVIPAAEQAAADFPTGSYQDGGFIATFTPHSL
jgi:hypothetical protein